jgi:hypothetical protein
MPVVGRSYSAIPNLVTTLPQLPTDIIRGNVSVECSFESHPTATVTIQDIPENEIVQYRSAWNVLGKEVYIYDYAFFISNYSETRNAMEAPGLPQPIVTYSIGINLQGINFEKVSNPIFVRRTKVQNSMFLNFVKADSSISLKNLAVRGGIDYDGFDYDITIPSDSGTNYSINFNNSVQNQLRVKGKFLDYTGRRVRAIDLNQGNTYIFTINEILDSIETSTQKPLYFKNTKLEGKDGIIAETESEVRRLKLKSIFGGDPLVKRPPKKRTLREGDVSPTLKPADVTSIKTLDLNFDLSGPRKTYREVTTQNDKVIQEVIRQYGFAYLARDIRNPLENNPNAPIDTPPLLSNNPQSFWKLVEEKITQYEYKTIDVDTSLRVKDPKTNKLHLVTYRDEEGKPVSTSFKNKYLTKITTRGWRLGRFQQETLGGDSDSDSRIIYETKTDPSLSELDQAYFNAIWTSLQFRRLPLKEQTSYFLVDPQNYYDKLEDIPFEYQKIEAKDLGLPASIGEVIVATPARDYVYPMYTLNENSQTHSYQSMGNPENILIRDERIAVINDGSLSESEKQEELRLLKYLPELSSGEDTFSVVRRDIQPSKNTRKRVPKNRDIEEDLYIEYSYAASNQDTDYKNSSQNIQFRETLGRPTQGEVLADVWVRKSELNSNTIRKETKFDFLLDSENRGNYAELGDSISVETSLLRGAVETAKIELAINNFLNTTQETLTLAWFYPYIKPGDFIIAVDTFTKKRKRVKSINFSLDYQGFIEGTKIVTSPGTAITLGVYEEIDVTYRKVPQDQNSEDVATANINVDEDSIGEKILFVDLKTRRNR